MAGAKDLKRFIEQMIRPIQNRLFMLVGRAVLESLKDDEGIQRMKLSLFADENRDKVERFQEYGFTSHPAPDTECVVVFPGGNRDHGLVIACENRTFRLKNLEQGEVALYTDEGDKIHFKRGNIIVVESPNVEIGLGALEKIVNGETFLSLFNAHTHLGNLAVPTGPPIVPMVDAVNLSQVVKGAK